MPKQEETRQQNSKCKLCGDREETISRMINKCCKLVPKECKTRNDSMRKMIHQELCNELKFDHTNKWSMNPSENMRHQIICDFKIQKDQQIPAIRPYLGN